MAAKIEKVSATPLYRQVMDKLRADIEHGVYPVDTRIPSEQELCDKYGVSRITVRAALKQLSADGLLVRRQGKGTYVKEPSGSKVTVKAVTSFHEACRSLGKEPSSKVLASRSVKATKEDLRKLNLAEGSRVVEIDRMQLADGVPVILERNHFPMVYEYLLEGPIHGSLYQLLRSYGVTPSGATHEIALIQADDNKAKLLGVSVGTPLLFLHEVIYDQKGRPLHTSHQYIRGDLFTLKL